MNKIDIQIQTLTGLSFYIKSIDENDTILALKNRILAYQNVPISQQHLIWKSVELKDQNTLSECGLQDGAKVQLVLHLKGGPMLMRKFSLCKDTANLLKKANLLEALLEKQCWDDAPAHTIHKNPETISLTAGTALNETSVSSSTPLYHPSSPPAVVMHSHSGHFTNSKGFTKHHHYHQSHNHSHGNNNNNARHTSSGKSSAKYYCSNSIPWNSNGILNDSGIVRSTEVLANPTPHLFIAPHKHHHYSPKISLKNGSEHYIQLAYALPYDNTSVSGQKPKGSQSISRGITNPLPPCLTPSKLNSSSRLSTGGKMLGKSASKFDSSNNLKRADNISAMNRFYSTNLPTISHLTNVVTPILHNWILKTTKVPQHTSAILLSQSELEYEDDGATDDWGTADASEQKGNVTIKQHENSTHSFLHTHSDMPYYNASCETEKTDVLKTQSHELKVDEHNSLNVHLCANCKHKGRLNKPDVKLRKESNSHTSNIAYDVKPIAGYVSTLNCAPKQQDTLLVLPAICCNNHDNQTPMVHSSTSFVGCLGKKARENFITMTKMRLLRQQLENLKLKKPNRRKFSILSPPFVPINKSTLAANYWGLKPILNPRMASSNHHESPAIVNNFADEIESIIAIDPLKNCVFAISQKLNQVVGRNSALSGKEFSANSHPISEKKNLIGGHWSLRRFDSVTTTTTTTATTTDHEEWPDDEEEEADDTSRRSSASPTSTSGCSDMEKEGQDAKENTQYTSTLKDDTKNSLTESGSNYKSPNSNEFDSPKSVDSILFNGYMESEGDVKLKCDLQLGEALINDSVINLLPTTLGRGHHLIGQIAKSILEETLKSTATTNFFAHKLMHEIVTASISKKTLNDLTAKKCIDSMESKAADEISHGDAAPNYTRDDDQSKALVICEDISSPLAPSDNILAPQDSELIIAQSAVNLKVDENTASHPDHNMPETVKCSNTSKKFMKNVKFAQPLKTFGGNNHNCKDENTYAKTTHHSSIKSVGPIAPGYNNNTRFKYASFASNNFRGNAQHTIGHSQYRRFRRNNSFTCLTTASEYEDFSSDINDSTTGAGGFTTSPCNSDSEVDPQPLVIGEPLTPGVDNKTQPPGTLLQPSDSYALPNGTPNKDDTPSTVNTSKALTNSSSLIISRPGVTPSKKIFHHATTTNGNIVSQRPPYQPNAVQFHRKKAISFIEGHSINRDACNESYYPYPNTPYYYHYQPRAAFHRNNFYQGHFAPPSQPTHFYNHRNKHNNNAGLLIGNWHPKRRQWANTAGPNDKTGFVNHNAKGYHEKVPKSQKMSPYINTTYNGSSNKQQLHISSPLTQASTSQTSISTNHKPFKPLKNMKSNQPLPAFPPSFYTRPRHQYKVFNKYQSTHGFLKNSSNGANNSNKNTESSFHTETCKNFDEMSPHRTNKNIPEPKHSVDATHGVTKQDYPNMNAQDCPTLQGSPSDATNFDEIGTDLVWSDDIINNDCEYTELACCEIALHNENPDDHSECYLWQQELRRQNSSPSPSNEPIGESVDCSIPLNNAAVSEVLETVVDNDKESPNIEATTETKTPRCYTCNKRVGISSTYTCRCDYEFCVTHRYPEMHACKFDYKEHGRRLLQISNPKLSPSTLHRMHNY